MVTSTISQWSPLIPRILYRGGNYNDWTERRSGTSGDDKYERQRNGRDCCKRTGKAGWRRRRLPRGKVSGFPHLCRGFRQRTVHREPPQRLRRWRVASRAVSAAVEIVLPGGVVVRGGDMESVITVANRLRRCWTSRRHSASTCAWLASRLFNGRCLVWQRNPGRDIDFPFAPLPFPVGYHESLGALSQLPADWFLWRYSTPRRSARPAAARLCCSHWRSNIEGSAYGRFFSRYFVYGWSVDLPTGDHQWWLDRGEMFLRARRRSFPKFLSADQH